MTQGHASHVSERLSCDCHVLSVCLSHVCLVPAKLVSYLSLSR